MPATLTRAPPPSPTCRAMHSQPRRTMCRQRCRQHQAKAAGLRNLPCKQAAENNAWLECVLAAADLVCWVQAHLLLRRALHRPLRDRHLPLPDSAHRGARHPRRPPRAPSPRPDMGVGQDTGSRLRPPPGRVRLKRPNSASARPVHMPPRPSEPTSPDLSRPAPGHSLRNHHDLPIDRLPHAQKSLSP